MTAQCNEPVPGSATEFEAAIIGDDIREQCVRLAHGVARIYLERYKASGDVSDQAAAVAAQEVAEAIRAMMDH